MKTYMLLPVFGAFLVLASCELERAPSRGVIISEINVSIPQRINIEFLADLNAELEAKLPSVQVFATVNGHGSLIFVEPAAITELDHKKVRDIYVNLLQKQAENGSL
jgi:hypothetical protein